MRSLLLEQLFADSGLSVSEGEISQQQLASASELFICSSIRGLLPVTEINNLGHWSIGEDTKRLQSQLFDLYDCYPC
jgi:4-amino-4-deoxychorismate lyase